MANLNERFSVEKPLKNGNHKNTTNRTIESPKETIHFVALQFFYAYIKIQLSTISVR